MSLALAASPAWRAGVGLAVLLLFVLAFANLTAYPAIWFDEAIHLHVPKALVRLGVYADYRTLGTLSVGPTVMLPLALAFEVAGVGLLQARVVMALYLLAAVLLYWIVAKRLGNTMLAALATALVVSSRGVDLVPYGRQVLGEVPALAFLLAGLWCWFDAWERPAHRRFVLAGMLFGFCVLAKYQYLLVVLPGLASAWALDRACYRLLPVRAYLWPLGLVVVSFAGWQAVEGLLLSPSGASYNLFLTGQVFELNALSFSTDRVARALREVFNPAVYSGLLVPAVLYGVFRGTEKSLASFRWSAVLCFVVAHLAWFVVASIGWQRYAFPSFALGALLVARFAWELTRGVSWPGWHRPVATVADPRTATALTVVVVMVMTIVAPLALELRHVLAPPPNAAAALARYLDRNISPSAIIETWDPEAGFLTDHRFHYPPPDLFLDAAGFIWGGGPAPSIRYDFRATGLPDYVLEGPFGRWVQAYPPSRLATAYDPKTTIGPYILYERRSAPVESKVPR